MGIADDLRACECAGCVKMEQPRTDYCDRCGNDAFVPVVAELEAIVRELAALPIFDWSGRDAELFVALIIRSREAIR